MIGVLFSRTLGFVTKNWLNLLLVVVGASALVIYVLQERRKMSEAASLILIQIDELQEKVLKLQSYIVDDQLNATAFYESNVLFVEDYWNKYKHYFVKKMDVKSFKKLNLFYEYVTEIQEQQELMKNLQKNFFFVTQQVLSNLEANNIQNDLNNSINNPINTNLLLSGLKKSMPSNLEEEQINAIENVLRQMINTNESIDFSIFWKIYSAHKMDIKKILNNNGLTPYIPEQIRSSLQKTFKQYTLLQVDGCEGYKLLSDIGNRKI